MFRRSVCFFMQKTAYEMRISDWSSDVCSSDLPSGACDYAILSLTLQATRDPRQVLGQMVRIARHAIVSFPNFGHWRVRLHLLFRGCMPVTEALPERWYETPNIHLCTVKIGRAHV